MNHGEATDRAIQATEEAGKTAKWFQTPASICVDGFATLLFRCLTCGAVNPCPLVITHTTEAPCSVCGVDREQERIYERPA